MARLLTCGFESQQIASGSPDPISANSGGAATTATVRSGAAALSIASGNTTTFLNSAGTAGVTLYGRVYFRKTATQSTAGSILRFPTSGTVTSLRIYLNTNDTLYAATGTTAGTGSSAALANNTWYRVEFTLTQQASGNGTFTVYVDGTQVSSATGAWTTVTANGFVLYGPNVTGTMFYDDLAINDSTGTANNGLPGDGKILLLKPTSTYTRNNWTNSDSSATTLNLAVDNTPPTGTLVATTTINNYIRNSNSTITSPGADYAQSVDSYTTAGLTSNDLINAVQAVTQHARDSTTSGSLGISMSNPTLAEVTGNSISGTAQAATPTGWARLSTAISNAPSVTLGTSPVVTIRKNTASTTVQSADFIGVLVDYTPSTALTAQIDDTLAVADAQALETGEGLTDTLSVADARSLEQGEGLSDTLAVADAQAYAQSEALADTLAVVDAAANLSTVQRTVTDASTVADSATTQSARQATVTDSITFVDNQTFGFGEALGDTTTITDSASAIPTKNFSDTLSVADSTSSQSVTERIFSDSLSVSDSSLANFSFRTLIDDLLTIEDFQTLLKVYQATNEEMLNAIARIFELMNVATVYKTEPVGIINDSESLIVGKVTEGLTTARISENQ